MSKPSFIAKQVGFLCVLMLVMIMLSASAVSAGYPPDPNRRDEGAQPEAPACTTDPAEMYKSPWMLYTNNPTEMNILFETDTGVDNDSNHIYIEFDQPDVNCSRDYYKMNIDLISDRRLWTFHCYGFNPNTLYSYTISYRKYYSSAIDYCWHEQKGAWFTSPPAAGDFPETLSFYGYGDTRAYDNTDALSDIAQRIVLHHNSNGNAGRFIIHTGDIVPSGGEVAYYDWAKAEHIDRWQNSFWDVDHVGAMLAQLPIFTTIGNHDFECHVCDSPENPLGCEDCDNGHQANYYYRYFKYPMYGTESGGNPTQDANDLGSYYYSSWWGPAMLFSLTTYPMEGYCAYSYPVTPDAVQYLWLEERLKEAANDPRWKIVFLHGPPYDADRSCNQQQVRDYLIPNLFEKYGVDLVLAGHEHYYARKEVKGIQYLVLGGGGSDLSSMGHPGDVDVARKIHHFAYFEIDGDTMQVTVIDDNGNPFDSFTLDNRPIADFTFSPDASISREVKFEDKSFGGVTSWLWDFGDDTTSAVQNPTHSYATSGTYPVKLTVRSYWNATSNKTLDVTTRDWTAFTAAPRSGAIPLIVTFTPEQAFSYSHWEFGDGAELQQPGTVHHTYLTNGTFSVTHISGEDANNTMRETQHDYITVGPNTDNDLEVVEPGVIYPPIIDK